MPITVRIQDEFGAPLDDGWDDVRRSEALVAPDAYVNCLPFIDPYCNTLFNQLHIPLLIGELMEHRVNTKNETLTRTLDSLISYLQHAEERVHVYVRFIGD
jgi:RNAse (barnase) inhibitor barstar